MGDPSHCTPQGRRSNFYYKLLIAQPGAWQGELTEIGHQKRKKKGGVCVGKGLGDERGNIT